MEIINFSEKSSFLTLGKILKKGNVVVLPTDTIYGFACIVSNKETINRIYEIKNRPKEKSFIVLCADLKMLKKYFVLEEFQEEILQIFVNDAKALPTTFILKPKKEIIKLLNVAENIGVAVRLPKNKFLSKIIGELNAPLISTSCNLVDKLV